MAKGQDLRSQATKATISWNPGWLGLRDLLGNRVGDCAKQGDFRNFRCKWCKKVGSGFPTKLSSIFNIPSADRAVLEILLNC